MWGKAGTRQHLEQPPLSHLLDHDPRRKATLPVRQSWSRQHWGLVLEVPVSQPCGAVQ